MAKVCGDRWEVIKSLDEGGQAWVHLVRDLKAPECQYALKRLKNDRRIGRFQREIEAVRRINHPGIVKLVDYTVELPDPWYVMEYMAGGSLAKRVDSYKGDIVRSLDLVGGICDVIRVAHEAKVCHRDLKPGNILFRAPDDETPVVADFGICWMEDGREFTASGEVVGTRFFTAPEIENGTAEDFAPAADAYSIGKILYYAITGGKNLAREDHRKLEFSLRYTVAPPDYRSLEGVQLEYVAELLDHLLDASPGTRWGQMGGILQEVTLRRRLVREGHYPVAAKDDAMPCKLCGRGLYRRHGPWPLEIEASFLARVAPDAARQTRWPFKAAMYECNYCGHLQAFSWEAFRKLTGAEEAR